MTSSTGQRSNSKKNGSGRRSRNRRKANSVASNRRKNKNGNVNGSNSFLSGNWQLNREAQVLAMIADTRDPQTPTIDNEDTDHTKIKKLRALALSPGGLGTDRARAKAWPVLLNVNTRSFRSPSMALKAARRALLRNQESGAAGEEQKAEWAKQERQVRLDVDRALGNVDVARAMDEHSRAAVRKNLNDSVLAVLQRQPPLHYYQGYHDVVTVFLLVTGSARAVSLSERYSQLFLREHHKSDFGETIALLRLLLPLLSLADPEVYTLLSAHNLEPFFALPWILTGFAHHMQNLHAVARLYDALLSSHPLLILYLCAAAILHPRVRHGLFLVPQPDAATLHGYLQELPQVRVINDNIDSTRCKRSRQRKHPGRISPEPEEEHSSTLNHIKNDSINWIDIDDLVSSALELMDCFPPCDVLVVATKLDKAKRSADDGANIRRRSSLVDTTRGGVRLLDIAARFAEYGVPLPLLRQSRRSSRTLVALGRITAVAFSVATLAFAVYAAKGNTISHSIEL